MQEVYKVYKKLFIPLLNYFGSLLVALLIGAFAWAQAHWRRLFLRAFAWARAQWKLMLIGLSVSLFILAVICFWFGVGPASVTFWLDPLGTELQVGNWKSFVCVLNTACHCAPERRRAILITREIANLTPLALNRTLSALEPMKQLGNLHFPVFLETSDFLWVQNERFIKSGNSFESYYLTEMGPEGGHTELVNKYNIWTAKDFGEVYSAVGGHMGSLRMLFDEHKMDGVPLREAIQQMDDTAERQMDAAMDGCEDRGAAKQWLTVFKENGYFLKVEAIPAVIAPLLYANIIFKKGYQIYPQNRLLQRAIGRYVTEFVD